MLNTPTADTKYKFNEIVKKRVPPVFWKIVGYVLSVYAVFNQNITLIYIISALAIIHFSLNIMFNLCTVKYELNEEILDEKIEINEIDFFDNLCWTNKICKYMIEQPNKDRTSFLQPEKKVTYYTLFDVNFYFGENPFMISLLNVIYFMGITYDIFVDKIKTDIIILKNEMKKINYCH